MKNVFVGICLALMASGCAAIGEKIVDKPKIDLQDVKVSDMTLTGATLNFVLKVANPNGFPLTVDALKYSLDVADKPISTGKVPHKLSVGAKDSTLIELPIVVKYTDIFSSVAGFVKNEATSYHVKGEAYFGILTIPFDKTGEVKLRK